MISIEPSHADYGLFPVNGRDPVLLILGSYPSVQSLARNEYYGNPQNQFWKIMEILFGIDHTLPYISRTAHLTKQRIALWDVLFSCSRNGSADTGSGILSLMISWDLFWIIRQSGILHSMVIPQAVTIKK